MMHGIFWFNRYEIMSDNTLLNDWTLSGKWIGCMILSIIRD